MTRQTFDEILVWAGSTALMCLVIGLSAEERHLAAAGGTFILAVLLGIVRLLYLVIRNYRAKLSDDDPLNIKDKLK